MKLSQLTRVAKDAIDKRGGMEAIKQDVQEARDAASGHDSLMDKARAAAGAFRQPGRDRGAAAAEGGAAPSPSPAGTRPAGAADRATPDPAAPADQDPPRVD